MKEQTEVTPTGQLISNTGPADECHWTHSNETKKYGAFRHTVPFVRRVCYVCSNANPLHYYALRVPRKVDRWH